MRRTRDALALADRRDRHPEQGRIAAAMRGTRDRLPQVLDEGPAPRHPEVGVSNPSGGLGRGAVAPSFPRRPGDRRPDGGGMSGRHELTRRFQRHPAVRLRRKSWGGFAFHRDEGDLVELDAEGFDAVAALTGARTLPSCAVCCAPGTIRRGVTNWRRSSATWRAGGSSARSPRICPTCPTIPGAMESPPGPSRFSACPSSRTGR